MQPLTSSLQIGDVRISVETGSVARQADAAVIVRQDSTVVLVTVVSAQSQEKPLDFLPLTVEFRELFGASGAIPHSYGKREGRQSDKEILSARLIDRSIRPLFPENYHHDTQIVVTLLSSGADHDADVLGLLGTCLALHISEIPWDGPAAGIRIAGKQGHYKINPSQTDRKDAEMELVVAAGRDGLIMVEGHASEVPEEDLSAALETARETMQPIFELCDHWRREIGRVKRTWTPEVTLEAPADLQSEISMKLDEVLSIREKLPRNRALASLKSETTARLAQGNPEHTAVAEKWFEDFHYEAVRNRIRSGHRLDGRSSVEIRPITGRTGWLPQPHGSAIFTRGETQSCVTCSLGPIDDALKIEGLHGDSILPFFLHYSFPPYAVGETRPLRGPGRREIGHGYLAWKSLCPVIPSTDVFPYAIRIYSEITESNGSSSMASICGGCLSLMDAGVPISRPVAGIAMGLIWTEPEAVILSDIIGDEDHLGDMDFKVAGTERGITAIQMDNKIGKLPGDVLRKALSQARDGRLHILSKMADISPGIRPELKPQAPRVINLKVRPDRIRDIIGPSGKTIQEIQRTTFSKIDISDDGRIRIYASSENAVRAAEKSIASIVREPEIGRYYRSRVVSVKPFGIFVEIFPGTEGLVHISEINSNTQDLSIAFKPGDMIPVKVVGVDERGRIKLSQKQALTVSETEFEE